jgi:hypothetical protein
LIDAKVGAKLVQDKKRGIASDINIALSSMTATFKAGMSEIFL